MPSAAQLGVVLRDAVDAYDDRSQILPCGKCPERQGRFFHALIAESLHDSLYAVISGLGGESEHTRSIGIYHYGLVSFIYKKSAYIGGKYIKLVPCGTEDMFPYILHLISSVNVYYSNPIILYHIDRTNTIDKPNIYSLHMASKPETAKQNISSGHMA